jgi:hypothetical protein
MTARRPLPPPLASNRAVVNPVEQISLALRRLRRIAALRAGLFLALPALTALALGAALEPIASVTWRRMGYAMAPQTFGDVRIALLAAGAAALAAGAWMARAAYRGAGNFVEAAARVDEAVGARQEIVTLAGFADPGKAEGQRAQRTPLFPLLWRRAIGHLERFDADRAFAFEIRRPLMRSLPVAAAIVVLLAAAALALVRPPSAAESEARKLRALAQQIANSANPADRSLAAKVFAAAAALENPKLPPQEKLARLDELMRELEKQPPKGSSPGQSAQSGSGKSNANGNGKGNGEGQRNGQGQGQGQGAGAGPGQKPNGPKSDRQIAELKNDVSKARAQIEAGSGAKNNAPQPGKGDKGNALKPGNDSNKKSPSNEPNALAEAKIPKPDTSARGKMPSGGKSGKQDKGGTGDTHLGEIPAPEKFERFYKLGKGPPIEVRDARYVLFRLPTEVASGNGGKLVADTNRPVATAPYANLPLKAERLDVAPQERQLVPPRYRDLIH